VTVNRSNSRNQANGPSSNSSSTNVASPDNVSANSAHEDDSNPHLKLSFDGLNHRQQRTANGGNQFSLEPHDQDLCAGNGFVMETINDVNR
jgi:hypothetical protein